MAHTNPWAEIGTVLIGAGGLTGITSLLTYRLAKRQAQDTTAKSMVDAAGELTDMALRLLEPVKTAAAEAEAQVLALQQRIRELETTVDSLTTSLATLTARSQTERDELTARLATAAAERDALAARLATREAELAQYRASGHAP